jgi:transposase
VKSSKTKKKSSHRRSFTQEFKLEAVKLAKEPNQSISKVAENLGLSQSVLRKWLKQEVIDMGSGSTGMLTSLERQEFSELKKENRQLRIEREILKKAAAFFAKEQM